MTRFGTMPLLVALVVLAGCHTMPGVLPVDLGAGWGRVDRSFAGGLGPVCRATLRALDDQVVHPTALSFRSVGEGQNEQAAVDVAAPLPPTNAEFLDGKLFGAEFFTGHHKIAGTNVPFDPVLMTYKGETVDGRKVVVIVRSARLDAERDASTVVMARVGHTGDAVWGRTFLDKVAGHLHRDLVPTEPTEPTTPVALPTTIPPVSTLPR